MELLFKREQTSGRMGRVAFKLWGKVELTEEETALVRRYRIDESVLIDADDDAQRNKAIWLGVLAFAVAAGLIFALFKNGGFAFLGGIAGGVAAGYWWLNEKRETVFVKDMLHGRHFTCESVVDLAKKEAWLGSGCAVFRQIMEGAKHWDGVERTTIEPLPKDQVKDLLARLA